MSIPASRETARLVEEVVADLLATDPAYASARELCRLALRDASRSGLDDLARVECDKFRSLVHDLLLRWRQQSS